MEEESGSRQKLSSRGRAVCQRALILYSAVAENGFILAFNTHARVWVRVGVRKTILSGLSSVLGQTSSRLFRRDVTPRSPSPWISARACNTARPFSLRPILAFYQPLITFGSTRISLSGSWHPRVYVCYNKNLILHSTSCRNRETSIELDGDTGQKFPNFNVSKSFCEPPLVGQ